jgi:hypothetical protein
MVNEDISQDDNTEQNSDGPPWGLEWRWPSLLLARLSPKSEDPQEQCLPLLLAPNLHGLEILGDLDVEVESIWIVRPAAKGSGASITETVESVCRWILPSAEYACALHCESGTVFVVDEDSMYEVDERTMHWSAGSKYRPQSPATK